jgi:tol-pal system protein YbgF
VTTGARSVVLAVLGLAGCATRAELLQQDRDLRRLIQDQRKQVREVQREVERLRGDLEEGPHHGGSAAPSDDRVSALEGRIAELERSSGVGSPAPGQPPPATAAPGNAAPGTPPASSPPAVASRPPTPVPAAPAGSSADEEWRRDVAKEQASAGTMNVPERTEYLTLLDGLAKQDCTRTVPQLNGFASSHKDSPLADNALYWAARCYAVHGDQNQAVTKFYDVVTKYPKGDKAAAALWAQGNLFVQMGDSPDARLAFSKLIREYPSSEEAARARQKLSELED